MIKIMLGILCIILVIFILLSLRDFSTERGKFATLFRLCLYTIILIPSFNFVIGSDDVSDTAEVKESKKDIPNNNQDSSSNNGEIEKIVENKEHPVNSKVVGKKYDPYTREWTDIYEDASRYTPGDILLDPSMFKEKFNILVENSVLGDDGYFVGDFQFEEGPFNNGAYYKLTPGIEIMLSIDTDRKEIKEIMIVCIEDGSIDTGPYNLATLESVIHIIDPTLKSREERLNILDELGLMSGMSTVLNNDGRTLFARKNDIMYSVEYEKIGEFASRYVFWVDIS